MSHQIGSRTPRRDTYVGFCLYEEEEDRHEVANRPSHKRPRIDGICITTLVNGHERARTATNGHESPRMDSICTAYKHSSCVRYGTCARSTTFQIDISNVSRYYDVLMFLCAVATPLLWPHSPVPPFRERVDRFPSDGATRCA